MGSEEVVTSTDEFESKEQRDKYTQLEEVLDEVREEKEERNLVKILHRAQKIFGHVNRDVQLRIAEGLGIPFSEVYSVVSFYSLFSIDLRGEKTLEVCMGTACYVKGSEDILQALQKKLKIEPGQTTEDNKHSLETTRCIGACGKAPVVVVGEDVKGGISPDEAAKLVEE